MVARWSRGGRGVVVKYLSVVVRCWWDGRETARHVANVLASIKKVSANYIQITNSLAAGLSGGRSQVDLKWSSRCMAIPIHEVAMWVRSP